MALSDLEKQELAELEELEALEKKYSTVGKSMPSAREQAELAAASPESMKTMEAALTGAAQGLTLGFSDELGAAADVTSDILTGKAPADLAAKWREYQKQRQAANKALAEESPVAYTLGEVGGGIGGVALTPALGAGRGLVGLAKAVPGLTGVLRAGELAAPELAALGKQAPGLLSRMTGKAAAGAIEAMPAAAVYGTGMSEKGFAKPEELAKDVASSIALGGATGAGLSVAGAVGKAGLGKLAEIGEGTDFFRKMKEFFKFGEAGIIFSTTSGKDIGDALINKGLPNKVVNQVMAADNMLGEKVGESLQKAQNAGVKINIDKDLQDSTKKLFGTFVDNPALMDIIDPKSKKVIQLIYSREAGDLTPIEARALKDTFYDLTNKIQKAGLTGDVPSLANMRAQELAKSLDSSLKAQIPEYAEAANNFYNFRKLTAETILQPDIPKSKRTVFFGDLKNKETELLEATRDLLLKSRLPGTSATGGARTGLRELERNLRTLQRTNPEAVRAMGGSAKEVAESLRKKADQMAGLKQIQGLEPHEGVQRTILGQIVGSGEGMALNVANKLGRVTKVVGQTAPVKMATKIFSSDDGSLLNLAKLMKQNKISELSGNALENAILKKDNAAKNAILFKMLQDPAYRSILKTEGYDVEE